MEKKQISESFLKKMSEYFKIYMMVGGMPSVVNAYLENKLIVDATREQKDIVKNYRRDILQYSADEDKQKIIATFDSIPIQLSKKNKKFVYSEIKGNDSLRGANEYFSSLRWLKDASIIHFCYNINEPAIPLATNIRQNSFKIYMRDTGLLLSMMENNIHLSINNDDIYVNKGAILENVCAEELATRYDDLIMYFERKSKLEIGFVLNIDGVVTAIEVKSGNNKQAKSLDSVVKNYKTVKRYIKLENDVKIYVDEKGIEHYPLFMILFI